MINIKNTGEVHKMRRVGEVVAKAHSAVKAAIAPGVTTKELDRVALEVIKSHGARASFKGYNGFPGNICTSINNRVIHGIPSSREALDEGDIIGIDIGAYLDGFHGDAAATYGVGEISDNARRLIEETERAFYKGIECAREGRRLFDISAAIQAHVEAAGFSIVRSFVGHGVGRSLHEEPEVPNFGTAGRGVRLYAGMTLAIEPMVNEGTSEVYVGEDGWTVFTSDGKLSAHYEHSIAITKGEPILLTRLD